MDIDETFPEEIIQFAGYMKQFYPDSCSPHSSLKQIRSDGILDTFPNVDIALRMYLTLPVANTEGERSFSVLKRVKNQLRSTLGQDKLCDLSLLTIEADLTKDIDFNNTIDDFARMKSRKKPL
jgi:hypothetical protein